VKPTVIYNLYRKIFNWIITPFKPKSDSLYIENINDVDIKLQKDLEQYFISKLDYYFIHDMVYILDLELRHQLDIIVASNYNIEEIDKAYKILSTYNDQIKVKDNDSKRNLKNNLDRINYLLVYIEKLGDIGKQYLSVNIYNKYFDSIKQLLNSLTITKSVIEDKLEEFVVLSI
jgi:hypothetical protein